MDYSPRDSSVHVISQARILKWVAISFSRGSFPLRNWTPASCISRRRLSDFTFTFHFHALEKEMAAHSIVLAWRIPGTGEAGGLPSMGSHRVGHDWSDVAAAAAAWDWKAFSTARDSLLFSGKCPSLQCGDVLFFTARKTSLQLAKAESCNHNPIMRVTLPFVQQCNLI